MFKRTKNGSPIPFQKRWHPATWIGTRVNAKHLDRPVPIWWINDNKHRTIVCSPNSLYGVPHWVVRDCRRLQVGKQKRSTSTRSATTWSLLFWSRMVPTTSSATRRKRFIDKEHQPSRTDLDYCHEGESMERDSYDGSVAKFSLKSWTRYVRTTKWWVIPAIW